MKAGDILLFRSGELSLVIETNYPSKGLTAIQCVEDDERRFCDTKSLEGRYENLGQEPSIVALYRATRGIHLRLNKLGKV